MPSLAQAGPSPSAVVPGAVRPQLMAGSATNTEMQPTEALGPRRTEASPRMLMLGFPGHARVNVAEDGEQMPFLIQAPTDASVVTTLDTSEAGPNASWELSTMCVLPTDRGCSDFTVKGVTNTSADVAD
jgi:hypothetical protein